MKNGMSPLGWVALVAFIAGTLFGCTSILHKIWPDDDKPLSIQASYVYRAGGTGPFLPITSGIELSSGDHYKTYFKANQDCYVYVYQTDATGQVFRLFPLKQFDGVMLNHNNPVKAEADVVLPSDDRFFYLDNTIGKEKIYFIASLQRNSDLETLEDRMANALRAQDERQISESRQAINAYLTKRGMGAISKTQTVMVAWNDGDATFPITGYLFESLKEENVHTLDFMHR